MNLLKHNTMKKLLTLIAIALLWQTSLAQTSIFVPVWSGNGLDHMNIYVTAATVNGLSIPPGSEIGVFDGDVCVGAAVRPNVIQNFIEIRVSKNDPTTPEVDGYTPGNPISFRIWDVGSFQIYTSVTATYALGSPFFLPGGTAMVSLNVNVNRPPVAVVGQSQIVNEGAAVTISGANSYDPDGDQLTFQWTVQPEIEGLDLSQSTLSFIAPEFNQHTTFTFTLVVSDGVLLSNPAFANLYVRDVNKPPVITGQQAIATNENQPITLTISMITYVDPDPGQTHTLIVYPGNNYLLSGTTITPVPYFSGTLSVPIRISDGIDQSNTFNLVVTVNPVNNPPAFTSIPPLSAVENLTYLYNITATDPDGDNMSFSAITKPEWLTLHHGETNGTAFLFGVPIVDDIGTHNISIALTDGVIEQPIVQSYTLNVQAATLSPVLLTNTLEFAYEGSLYTSSLEFFDVDSDSLLVSLNNAPAWLSLQGAVNGVARLKFTNQMVSVNLTGTPPIGSAGINTITIQFTDKENISSRILPLRVYAQNTPPTALDVIVETDENQSVLVVLQGTDQETPSGLIYELLTLPEFGVLEPVSSRIFIYTPNPYFFGVDQFEYRVKEPGNNPLFADASVVVNVNFINDAPVISIPNRYISTQESVPVVVQDIDYNDELDGEYASELELVALFGPFGGTFDAVSHTYTPNENFYGTDLVYIVARELDSNGLDSDPLMIWFDVEMVNQTAYVSLRDIFLDEDTQATFIPVIYDREADIENIQYNIILPPSNGTLSINGLALTYIPNPNWFGTDYAVFQAQDFHGDWTPDLELFFHVNPVNDSPTALFAEVNAQGGSSVTLDFSAWVTDIDNPIDELEIDFLLTDANGNGTGLLPSVISPIGGSGMLFTYTSQHGATEDVIPYRVFDLESTSSPSLIHITNLAAGKGATKSDAFVAKGDYLDITWGDTLEVVFTFIVGGDNSTPPDVFITNAPELNGQLTALELLFHDPSNPIVTYRATYVAPVKPNDDEKPSGNDTEVLFDRIGFKGSKSKRDGKEESNADSIFVGNLQLKVPTTIHPIVQQETVEGEPITVQISYTDPDTPPASIAWAIGTGVPGVTHSFNTVGANQVDLQLIPPIGFYGNMVVSVSATDDTTTTAREFTLAVESLNQPPQIRMADSLFYLPNTLRVVAALITDRETPTHQLSINFTAEPENAVDQMVFSGGDLSITPAQGYTGDFFVNVSASDDTNTSTHQLKLKYKASNAMPMLLPIPTATTIEDTPKTIVFAPTDPDPQDLLEVTIESSNQQLISSSSISISPAVALTGVQRTVTFTPMPDRHGTSDITVYVNDGLKTIAQQFVLNVLPINDAPVLSEIEDQTMYNNKSLVLALSATDIDSYIFTFNATSSNPNLHFNVVENILTINVLNGYYGQTEFTVTVADDSLATHSQIVPLTVLDGTSAPTIDGISILIYPNPTNGLVNIVGLEDIKGEALIRFYTIHGQIVMERIVNGSQNATIDVSKLSKGIYIVEIAVNGKSLKNKLIVK